MILVACTKDDETMIPQNEIAFKGDFVSSSHPTSGVATVNMDETMLKFTSFKTDPGPQLNIYLASDIDDILDDFIDLGEIKGVNGDYSYDIPSNTDLTDYKYVVVWCVEFDVNFGYAILAP